MSKNIDEVLVNGNEFKWDKKEGLFTFDGAPSLLFWDTAIELFLNTIEEVSGKEVSKAVHEATGYRMGHLVSSYYSGRKDLEQLLVEYSDVYRNAGWGNVEVVNLSFEEKNAVIRLTNSWEHRIFNESGNEHTGVLLPSHWAGVFSGLFGVKMWYKMNKSQIEGHPYDEIELYLSTYSPAQNIHDITRQKEMQSILELEQKVKERTEELTSLVKELSSPVIPVLNGILVVPMIGNYNEERIMDLMENVLMELSRQQANYLLIDVTGLKKVDAFTIQHIQKLNQAVQMLGGKCFLVGISAELSIRMINSGVDLEGIVSFMNLQQGVEFAIRQLGIKL